jgi:hypothetical protein
MRSSSPTGSEPEEGAYEQLLKQGGDRLLREASAYFAGEGMK